jgi:hypothetical protein
MLIDCFCCGYADDFGQGRRYGDAMFLGITNPCHAHAVAFRFKDNAPSTCQLVLRGGMLHSNPVVAYRLCWQKSGLEAKRWM